MDMQLLSEKRKRLILLRNENVFVGHFKTCQIYNMKMEDIAYI